MPFNVALLVMCCLRHINCSLCNFIVVFAFVGRHVFYFIFYCRASPSWYFPQYDVEVLISLKTFSIFHFTSSYDFSLLCCASSYGFSLFCTTYLLLLLLFLSCTTYLVQVENYDWP